MLLIELKVSYDRNSVDAKELTRLATAARTEVWDTTLPFGTDSLRILPEPYWESVHTTLLSYALEFKAVSGGKAVLSHSLLPYPIVGMEDTNSSALQALLREQLQERECMAEETLKYRVRQSLTHVADRLGLKIVNGEAIPHRFHDTLFSNLSSENALHKAFNEGLFDNTSFYAVFDGVDTVAGHDPKAVRKDAALRLRLCNLCRDLINTLSNA